MNKNEVLAELDRANVELNAIQIEMIGEIAENPAKLANYADDGSTDVELASIYGLPVAALKPFAAVLAKSRAMMALRIRRALLATAEKGNSDSLAYLAGKYLSVETTR